LIERCHQQDQILEFKDSVLHAAGFVEWLVEDYDLDSLMDEDRNDVLDWDGNNDD